jgi:hypothetical protein
MRCGKWATRHEGLFTFAHSPKHIALYHEFGFWARFLTAIMSKPVSPISQVTEFSRYSEVPACERAACLTACRELTDTVYEGRHNDPGYNRSEVYVIDDWR